MDESGDLVWVRVVVSAVGARPHVVGGLERFRGRALDDRAVEEIARVAHRQCHPLTNINVDPGWRREMVPVFVRRAFAQARERHALPEDGRAPSDAEGPAEASRA
jgi:4-hydroxybenzoyl-CoA reductase subunit beta